MCVMPRGYVVVVIYAKRHELSCSRIASDYLTPLMTRHAIKVNCKHIKFAATFWLVGSFIQDKVMDFTLPYRNAKFGPNSQIQLRLSTTYGY